jgi:hypothetical protein
MYLSLSDLDVAVARHRELVAVAERNVRFAGVHRSERRLRAIPLRRSAGVMLVRLGERLQGCPCPAPCGS